MRESLHRLILPLFLLPTALRFILGQARIVHVGPEKVVEVPSPIVMRKA